MRCSVVIPTYRRRETLAHCLAAWEKQAPRDLDFELVVIDDGSDDGTADLLANHRPRRHGFRFARQDNAGPARARNRALALARGELVLFTGDDIEPAPDLLHQHLEAHRRQADPKTAILGLTCWPEGAPTTATMRHIDGVGAQQFSYHFFEDGAEYDFRHLYTSNISLHRALLDREVEGFSTDFPAAAFEDAEYGYRLAHHGLRIRYHRAAVAWHHHPYEARGFFRRQMRCGEMAAILWDKRPELRRYLDLDALEEARTEILGQRSQVKALELEERALRLASFYDPLPFEAADLVLRPLFRQGYLRGLAQALYPAEVAERILGHLFVEQFTPALGALQQQILRRRLPYPSADLEALLTATGL